MRQECRIKVGEILGRDVTAQEGQQIVNSLKFVMRNLRNTEPDFGSLTQSQQTQKAAEVLAQQVLARAAENVRIRNLEVLAQAKKRKEMQRLRDDEGIVGSKAIAQVLVNADNYNRAIGSQYIEDLVDLFNGIDSHLFGLMEDKKTALDVIRAAFGEKSTELAQKAFGAFDKVNSALLTRATNAGLMSGKLDRYIPQNHDWYKLARAGADKWVEDIKPLLDQSRFLNDDGTQMSQADIDSLLYRAFENIVTDGNPESALDVQGQIKSKRKGGKWENQHRVLHFKDADSWMAYHSAYGSGSVSNLLMGHIQRMAHDVGMLEQFGPNPDATYRALKTIAETEELAARKGGAKLTNDWKYSNKVGVIFADIDDVWKNLTGEANAFAKNNLLSHMWGDFMQGVRNLNVAGKLGKALITSFSDIASYMAVSGVNNIGLMDRIIMLPRVMGPGWKAYAARLGVVSESLINDFNRWSGDNLGQGWTSKVANTAMRITLLPWWTDSVRRAFSMNMMAGLAKMSELDWQRLHHRDRSQLTNSGITEADWEIIRSAGVEKFRGTDFLNFTRLKEISPETASKLLSFVVKENEMASLNPTIVTRAGTNRGLQRGDVGGEIARSVFLFKAFPLAFMEKHVDRVKFLSRHGSKADLLAYTAWIVVGTTILGAVSEQTQQLANGKDLRDMSNVKFWRDAMLKGGGLGFIGNWLADLASDEPSQGAYGMVNMLGPVAGDVMNVIDFTASLKRSALYDKDTKPGAKLLKIVRGWTPVVNTWYASAALDRAVFNELNEFLSRGYIRKMVKRTKRKHGQGYWWSPTDVSEMREPRIAKEPRK